MVVVFTKMKNAWSSEKWFKIGYILNEGLKRFARGERSGFKQRRWVKDDAKGQV